jgi:predicted unusual protein kinase regulating ubiquinone biosynthesis (AarF/ABC1/UbiB family)
MGAQQLAQLGFSPDEFAVALLRLQLSMSYEHGLIHGDTHPGNLILCDDLHIGLIDFGLHGHVGRELRDKMLELLFHQTSGRTADAVAAFSEVFTPGPNIDRGAFERELTAVLEPRDSPTAKDARLTAQLIDGLRVGARYELKVRSELFLVLRNLTIVEGIVVKYAPDLNLNAEVQQILSTILRRRLAAQKVGEDLEKFLPLWLLTMAQRPQFMDRVLRLERVFTESKNLGDFLRREGVIGDGTNRRNWRALEWAIALVAGVALGASLTSAWMMWGSRP